MNSDDDDPLPDPRVALVAQPTDVGQISGIAITFRDENAAKLFFDFLHAYLRATGVPKKVTLKFEDSSVSPGKILCVFSIRFDTVAVDVAIDSVSSEVRDQLIENSKKFRFYFVLAGWHGDGDMRLLDPAQYHFFKKDFWVGDTHIMSASPGLWPSSHPFGGIPGR
jgi:hypothetical protein